MRIDFDTGQSGGDCITITENGTIKVKIKLLEDVLYFEVPDKEEPLVMPYRNGTTREGDFKDHRDGQIIWSNE